MKNLLFSSLNGSIIHIEKDYGRNDIKNLYLESLSYSNKYNCGGELIYANNIFAPGDVDYRRNNPYNLRCQNCNQPDNSGCCIGIKVGDEVTKEKYYIELQSKQPFKKLKSQIKLFALDQITEFEIDPDYEEVTVDTSDNPKIYAKVSFADDNGNPVVFANKYMRCKITKGACKVINKTNETGVAWVELNVNGQIGNNEVFEVSSIDDGNTDEYTPFIGSSIKFTMLA